MDEEVLFETVAAEIGRGSYDQGLMARAVADSLGDERLAQSLYIRYRVAKLAEQELARRAENRQRREAEEAETSAGDEPLPPGPEWPSVAAVVIAMIILAMVLGLALMP